MPFDRLLLILHHIVIGMIYTNTLHIIAFIWFIPIGTFESKGIQIIIPKVKFWLFKVDFVGNNCFAIDIIQFVD